MTLPELSIKRTVFATVMSLALALVGLVCYQRLSVREYPAIDPPVVTVQTDYPGASAAIVDTQVTKVLEETLSGIEGIDFITSISRQESSQITVRFKLNRDADYAAADVRDRVGRARGRLPDEIEEPMIQKVEADAQPILHLAFFSDRHNELEITDYADRYVKDQLQTLPGVNIRCASGSIPSGLPVRSPSDSSSASTASRRSRSASSSRRPPIRWRSPKRCKPCCRPSPRHCPKACRCGWPTTSRYSSLSRSRTSTRPSARRSCSSCSSSFCSCARYARRSSRWSLFPSR